MGSIPPYRAAGVANAEAKSQELEESEEERHEAEPAAKRLKLAQSPDSVESDAKQKKYSNTIRSTTWAVKTFYDWKKERNESFPDADQVPDDLLDQIYDNDVSPLVHWLSKFLVEARNKEGKMYSLCSLHGIMCGILRYMREKNLYTPNFMDKHDPQFKELHVLMNTTFANLREHGVRIYRKEIPVITLERENELWERRIMGTDTPISLQRAVFYTIGKTFFIKGGLEHRALKPSQFTRERNPDGYTFTDTGRGSKNSGHCHKVFANSSAGIRCLVYLLDLYFSKLPSYAYDKDILYLRPKASFLPKENRAPWYEAFPVGREKLRTMTHDMCVDGGLLTSTSQVEAAQPSTSSVTASQATLSSQAAPSSQAVTPSPLQIYQQPFLVHYQPVSTPHGKEGVCLVPMAMSTGSSKPPIPVVKVILPDNSHHQELSTGQMEASTSCQISVQSTSGPDLKTPVCETVKTSHPSLVEPLSDLEKTSRPNIQESSVGSNSDLEKTSHPSFHVSSVEPLSDLEETSRESSIGSNSNRHEKAAHTSYRVTVKEKTPQNVLSVASNFDLEKMLQSHVTLVQHSNDHHQPLVRHCELTDVGNNSDPVETRKMVQCKGCAGTGKHSMRVPDLNRRPSREHYEVISKIVSAIETSDDPDLHCVYVCVHKCRRLSKGRESRAAEAPF